MAHRQICRELLRRVQSQRNERHSTRKCLNKINSMQGGHQLRYLVVLSRLALVMQWPSTNRWLYNTPVSVSPASMIGASSTSRQISGLSRYRYITTLTYTNWGQIGVPLSSRDHNAGVNFRCAHTSVLKDERNSIAAPCCGALVECNICSCVAIIGISGSRLVSVKLPLDRLHVCMDLHSSFDEKLH